MKRLYILLLVFALAGFGDGGYLTYEFYARAVPPCSINAFFSDCGRVLGSRYATLMGWPLSLWGVFHYGLLLLMLFLAPARGERVWMMIVSLLAVIGLSVSGYLVYLQAFVLQAFCLYCMISALMSLLIFVGICVFWRQTFVHSRKTSTQV